MTTQQQKDFIREKCIEANPEDYRGSSGKGLTMVVEKGCVYVSM